MSYVKLNVHIIVVFAPVAVELCDSVEIVSV